MAKRQGPEREGLKQDRLVEALIPDPAQGPPDTTVLHGYLGKATTEGVWRLYQTAKLDSYVEIPESEILFSQQLPNDQGTSVWVRKDLPVEVVRPGATQVQAEFLAGPIAGANLGRAARVSRARAAAGAAGPVVTAQVSAVDACPSVRLPCASDPRMCRPYSWRLCPPSRMFICESIHVPCGPSALTPFNSAFDDCPSGFCPPSALTPCNSALDACPSRFCGPSALDACGATEFCAPSARLACDSAVDACPSWICGPEEVVDPRF